MALMSTGLLTQLLDPGLRKVFFMYLKESPPEYKQWMNVMSTARNTETDHKISEFGNIPEIDEGDPIQFEAVIPGSTKVYSFPEYAMGFIITRKMIDDDLYGIMVKMTKALRRSVRNTFEVIAYRILNNCTSTSSAYLGIDSKALLATDHPNLGGGTQANKPSTDCDLSRTAVEAAVLHFHALKGEQNMPIFVNPALTIVDSTKQFLAAQIFRNSAQYGTADRNDNLVKMGPDGNGLTQYLPSRYFTDTNQWFVAAEKSQHMLNMFVRVQPEFETGNDFSSGNVQVKTYFRVGIGHTDWRGIYGSTGSS